MQKVAQGSGWSKKAFRKDRNISKTCKTRRPREPPE